MSLRVGSVSLEVLIIEEKEKLIYPFRVLTTMVRIHKSGKIQICKLCRKKKDKLSRRGFCIECSRKLNQDAVSQLRVKKGEIYERWRERIKSIP